MTSEKDLDAALAQWATRDPLTGAGDEAALLRILQHADAVATDEPRRRPLWWIGGVVAVAASVAMALLLTPGSIGTGVGGKPPADGGTVMLAQADASESVAFALLYTPTTEEEYQL